MAMKRIETLCYRTQLSVLWYAVFQTREGDRNRAFFLVICGLAREVVSQNLKTDAGRGGHPQNGKVAFVWPC